VSAVVEPQVSQLTSDALPRFESRALKRGRSGVLHLVRDGRVLPPLETPHLFPVVNLVTGTTAKGGGIWRYIADDLLDSSRADTPIMSQALQFLDYHVSPKKVTEWRSKPLRDHYRDDRGVYPVDFQAPMFLDSGGFKLLFTPKLALEQYGLLKEGDEARSILALQRDFGGDLVASLDYPIPPNLDLSEANDRLERTMRNALAALRCLADDSEFRGFTPMFYVACHGQTPELMERHVRETFERITTEGLQSPGIGMAIGSLVPLRGSHRLIQLVQLAQAALRGIPEDIRPTTPIHVFGISGDLMPLLTYLGIDTFDSSTYVQSSRNLTYLDPRTRRKVRLLELEGLNCDCRICVGLNFDELHETLTAKDGYKPQETGVYKSLYYAKVALHNFEMERKLLHETQAALAADNLGEFLVEHAVGYPGIQAALYELARHDEVLAPRITRVISDTKFAEVLRRNGDQLPLPLQELSAVTQPARPTISLRFTPDDFRVRPTYRPPDGKDLLLVIPCSETKPYSESRSHRVLARRLEEHLEPSLLSRIHKVALSGLYGPVPVECEEEENVLHYNFLLSPLDTPQIVLCADRLTAYLQRHQDHYQAAFGYATSKAYRTVLRRVATKNAQLQVYPVQPASQMPTEFYRNRNLDELVEAIKQVNQACPVSDCEGTREEQEWPFSTD
jgi:7-cyano-7-deazaguanine tRNA-ribosyltransferase